MSLRNIPFNPDDIKDNLVTTAIKAVAERAGIPPDTKLWPATSAARTGSKNTSVSIKCLTRTHRDFS